MNTSRIPPPQSAQEFEQMVNSAAPIKWDCTDFQLYGRPGQKQDGVDIYAHTGKHHGISIQCKNTCHALPFQVIKSEAEKAEKFPQKITRLYIATTQPHDISLQNSTWNLSEEYKNKGKFSISIFFWGEIIHELARKLDILFSFYPEIKYQLNDEKILQEIKLILPYNQSIAFVKDYGFSRRIFDDNQLCDLYNFRNRCDDPSFAFVNQRLEHLRKNLLEKIRSFNGLINYHYTRSLHSHGLERHEYHDMIYAESIREQLTNAADELITAYSNLVRPY